MTPFILSPMSSSISTSLFLSSSLSLWCVCTCACQSVCQPHRVIYDVTGQLIAPCRPTASEHITAVAPGAAPIGLRLLPATSIYVQFTAAQQRPTTVSDPGTAWRGAGWTMTMKRREGSSSSCSCSSSKGIKRLSTLMRPAGTERCRATR